MNRVHPLKTKLSRLRPSVPAILACGMFASSLAAPTQDRAMAWLNGAQQPAPAAAAP